MLSYKQESYFWGIISGTLIDAISNTWNSSHSVFSYTFFIYCGCRKSWLFTNVCPFHSYPSWFTIFQSFLFLVIASSYATLFGRFIAFSLCPFAFILKSSFPIIWPEPFTCYTCFSLLCKDQIQRKWSISYDYSFHFYVAR